MNRFLIYFYQNLKEARGSNDWGDDDDRERSFSIGQCSPHHFKKQGNKQYSRGASQAASRLLATPNAFNSAQDKGEAS